jgi:YD repeat-containing protein
MRGTDRRVLFSLCLLIIFASLPVGLWAQTNCDEGNGPMDSAQPKTLTWQQVIEKLGVAETAAKKARLHYTFTQDVSMQTLSGTSVTGAFHEVTTVSYDSNGRRQEVVTYAAQPTLRGIQLTGADMEDVRTFMPLMLGSDDLAGYNLSYDGEQHVDDLDTYVFHVEPKKMEGERRYFQGRIWVDAQDFQIVKLCGKSGPEKTRVKKHEHQQLQPMFVTYRQQVDGNWLPAYTRADDYLQFPGAPAHLRQIVKYTGYKKVAGQ